MNRWNKVLALASITALCVSANSLMAQGGNNGGGNNGGGNNGGGNNGGGFRNMDPAARRQAQIDQYKDRFEITDDGEWNAISPAIGKVIDAQQAARAAAFGGFGRGGRNGGGPNGGGNTDTTGNNQGGGRRNRNNGGGPGGPGGAGNTPSPEMQALQAALDAKASTEEIKAKLERVRAVAKDKEAKLTAAQSDLVKLLTPRQEATGVLYGLLK